MKAKEIAATELDQRFDDGEDVLAYFDLENVERPDLELQSVNIDFPQWMLVAIDQEAQRLGVARQAVIKFWLADRLRA